jgi:hypothetical protein
MDGTIIVAGMVVIFIIAIIKYISDHNPEEPEPPPEEPNPLYGEVED